MNLTTAILLSIFLSAIAVINTTLALSREKRSKREQKQAHPNDSQEEVKYKNKLQKITESIEDSRIDYTATYDIISYVEKFDEIKTSKINVESMPHIYFNFSEQFDKHELSVQLESILYSLQDRSIKERFKQQHDDYEIESKAIESLSKIVQKLQHSS